MTAYWCHERLYSRYNWEFGSFFIQVQCFTIVVNSLKSFHLVQFVPCCRPVETKTVPQSALLRQWQHLQVLVLVCWQGSTSNVLLTILTPCFTMLPLPRGCGFNFAWEKITFNPRLRALRPVIPLLYNNPPRVELSPWQQLQHPPLQNCSRDVQRNHVAICFTPG